MSAETCSVDGCERKVLARVLCSMHYERKRKKGDAGGADPTWKYHATPGESFVARQSDEGDCSVWTGARNKDGYGVIHSGGYVRAHRYAWERANGPIPEGMAVDHMCHNRACVKLEHLRLVTYSQNSQNRAGAVSGSKSGIRNVHWHEPDQAWIVRAVVKGKVYSGGWFKDLDEAAVAAQNLRKEVMPWSIK